MGMTLGYQQTEIGVIPEDWVVASAKDLGKPVRGGSPRPAGDPRYFDGAFIPWLTVAALTNIPQSQLVVSATASCLTEEGASYSRMLSPGTLIIANSGATLGVAKILGIKCCANDGIAALLNLRSDVSAPYLAHFFNSKTGYLRDVVATGNGQPNLNTELIGSFRLALPPSKEEQDKVAEALSDADALIESLEQLLAKKRQIKQGAMQELLTGKKRLPGFKGGWESRKLCELSTMASGGTPPTSVAAYYGGEIPWVSISDMTKGGKVIDATDRSLTALGFSMSAAQMFPVGTILYAMYASLGECAIAGADLSTSQAILGIRTRKALDPEFLYYWLTMRKSAVKVMGQQGTQANLNKGMVEAFRLSIPTVLEQKAISSVLSGMDNELTALETKLTKARQLKQGLMQDLLTGRIRLV